MRRAFAIILIVLVFRSPCAARKEENDQKLSKHISEIEKRDVLSIPTKNEKHPMTPNDLSKPKDYLLTIHSTNPVHYMNPVQPRDTAHLTNTAQVPVQTKQNFIKGSQVDVEKLHQQLHSKKSSRNVVLPIEAHMIRVPSRRGVGKLIVGLAVALFSELIPRNQNLKNNHLPKDEYIDMNKRFLAHL